MNPRSRTFTTIAVFSSQPEILYPNLTAEANILIREKKNAMTIPSSYLVKNQYVLTSPSESTKVETGISNLQWVEIVKGIENGQVIYKPQQ